MRAGDLFAIPAANLGRRKGRTLLTLTGVVIGAAALVLLVSLGLGLRHEVLKVFQNETELRTLRVMRVKEGTGGGGGPFGFAIGGLPVPIPESELAEMRRLPNVEVVVPDLELLLFAEVEGKTIRGIPVSGAIPPDEASLRANLRAGRLWSSSDAREVILPSLVIDVRLKVQAEELIGRTIEFSRGNDEDPAEPRTFTVVGVLDSDRLGLQGRFVYGPWSSILSLREAVQGGLFAPAYRKDAYASVIVRAADSRHVDDLKNRLKNLNYQVITGADIVGAISTVFLVVEAFMGAIGAIGLIVALFGIANTMAMSVLERTREIGIMKALGARPRDIRRLFLLEATAIGLMGGLVGLGLAALGGLAAGGLARRFLELPESVTLFHISAWLAAGSVIFSTFVSVVAGLVPAVRASRLDPVRALRYE